MKSLFYLSLSCMLFWLAGCSQNNTSMPAQEPHKYALQQLLDSCLIQQPNAMNNDVSRSILADSIKTNIQRFIGNSLPFISELPLKYEGCIEYTNSPYIFDTKTFKHEGKYLVSFEYGEIGSKNKISNNYHTTFQIFTIMDKEQVATLIDNAYYSINGNFVDFANNSQETGFVLPSGKCLIDYPKVRTSSISDGPFINLGTIVLENVSFTRLEQTK